MNRSTAEIIRSGILDARNHKPYYIRITAGSVVYLGGRLYREAYERTSARMQTFPPKGSAGGSRP